METVIQICAAFFYAVHIALYGGLVLFVVLGIPYVCLKTLLRALFSNARS
jgi:hypothetical protein